MTVTVNGAGALRTLSFGPAADQALRARLADLGMVTARRAQASKPILAIMAPLVGEDSDAMRFAEEQIPPATLPKETAETESSDYPRGHALNEEYLAEEPAPKRPEPPPIRRRPIAEDASATSSAFQPIDINALRGEARAGRGRDPGRRLRVGGPGLRRWRLGGVTPGTSHPALA